MKTTKRIATLFLATFLCLQAWAQQMNLSSMLEKPRVDRNVELMSIVWRLAGADEYGRTFFKLYTDRIEEHFGQFSHHKTVEFARQIRADHGISYDAVASMAMHLDGKLNLRTDVADGSLEGRWTNVDRECFVELLKKFAAETRFDDFYQNTAPLYTEASERFEPAYEAIDLKWYTDFFGQEPKDEFKIINALGNGGANYGVSVERLDGKKEVYAIMGAWSVDDQGMTVFPLEQYFPTLLHEFNHSFINHLAEKHSEAFRESGEKLFVVLGDYMRRQAYSNPGTMMHEALVRAAVVKYEDHDVPQEQLYGLIRMEEQRAFLWTKPLAEELDKYSASRDQYPTLDSYMPRLAEAYPEWVEKIVEGVKAAQEAKAAQATGEVN